MIAQTINETNRETRLFSYNTLLCQAELIFDRTGEPSEAHVYDARTGEELYFASPSSDDIQFVIADFILLQIS